MRSPRVVEAGLMLLGGTVAIEYEDGSEVKLKYQTECFHDV